MGGLTASDARRKEIREVMQQITAQLAEEEKFMDKDDEVLRDSEVHKWAKSGSSIGDTQEQSLTGTSIHITNRMRLEGIDFPRAAGILFARLVKVYCARGDLNKAVRWAKEARTLSMVYNNNGGVWDAIVEAPKKTNYWEVKKLSESDVTDRLLGMDMD